MKKRLKHFVLGTDQVLLMAQGKLRIANIPEGAIYKRCQYDFLRDALLIVVEHPSFDEVDDACEPPMVLVKVEYVIQAEVA